MIKLLVGMEELSNFVRKGISFKWYDAIYEVRSSGC